MNFRFSSNGVVVVKEGLSFNDLPLSMRLNMFKKCNFDPDRIWTVLGDEAFAFFYAMKAFREAYIKGIEIENFQFKHYNVTRSEIEAILK